MIGGVEADVVVDGCRARNEAPSAGPSRPGCSRSPAPCARAHGVQTCSSCAARRPRIRRPPGCRTSRGSGVRSCSRSDRACSARARSSRRSSLRASSSYPGPAGSARAGRRPRWRCTSRRRAAACWEPKGAARGGSAARIRPARRSHRTPRAPSSPRRSPSPDTALPSSSPPLSAQMPVSPTLSIAR